MLKAAVDQGGKKKSYKRYLVNSLAGDVYLEKFNVCMLSNVPMLALLGSSTSSSIAVLARVSSNPHSPPTIICVMNVRSAF